MLFRSHGESIEICIEGTNGWLLVEGWDNPLQASDSELLKLNLSQDKIQLYTAKTEQANFIECIKSRKEPYHPAEDMHRTATIAHMGVIAMKLKRKLQWNPAKEEFVNDTEANAMRAREERDPWKLENLIVYFFCLNSTCFFQKIPIKSIRLKVFLLAQKFIIQIKVFCNGL